MNKTILNFIFSFFLLLSIPCLAQEAKKVGYLEVKGRISKDRKPLDGAQVSVTKNGKWIDNLSTSGGGKFKVNLDMNSDYLLTFSSPGCYNKSINISTLTNEKNLSFVWSYSFSVDLVPEIPGLKNAEVFNKPIARVVYKGEEGAFNYDEKYTSAAQSELNKVINAAIARQNSERDKRIQDSINALKLGADAKARAEAEARKKKSADSLAQVRAAMDAKAKADLEARRKHSADSLNASLKAKQDADRAKQLTDQRAKQIADSLGRVNMQLKAKHKADSIAKAQADAQARALADKAKLRAQHQADSIAKVQAAEKVKLDALRAKQKADSLARAQVLAAERAQLAAAKRRADSVAKAEADKRAKALAEELRIAAEKLAKHKADSMAQVELALKKAEEERLKQLQKQREDSLAEAQLLEQRRLALEKQKAAELAAQAKKEPDSYKEETITEKNRSIQRTTVVKGGKKSVFEIITYSWGQVLYFQNGTNITKATFDIELDKSKK